MYGFLSSETDAMASELHGSISRWLPPLKEGNDSAIQAIWERYFASMVRLTGKKLRLAEYFYACGEEEDVAQSAFHQFCIAVREGRFPQLEDRDDLWRILVHVTTCKVADRIDYHKAVKRGGRSVVRETDLESAGRRSQGQVLDQVIGADPTPDFVVEVAEECERLLNLLHDPTLRQIAEMKLAGFTHEQIRTELNCTLRSITLKVRLIRKCWEGGR